MELLIPRTVRAILNKGRLEGRQEERKRLLAALREARARSIVPDTPEFEEFILGFEPDKTDDFR